MKRRQPFSHIIDRKMHIYWMGLIHPGKGYLFLAPSGHHFQGERGVAFYEGPTFGDPREVQPEERRI